MRRQYQARPTWELERAERRRMWRQAVAGGFVLLVVVLAFLWVLFLVGPA